ncbi:MAG TPA: hypothetical protein VHQ21_16260 [Rhodanobacteraceae bacterium]|jgi:hypothetical protein|nr:hypothetical protein [Rhodanobacteraceae bacterium]
MIRRARFAWFAAAVAVSGSAALAQSGGGYDLHWNVPATGGGAMNGAGYSVTGAVGQHAVSMACASGYTLRSGFWAGVPETDVTFRDGFEPGC